MNDRRPTELELAAALRAHLPTTASADLRDRMQVATVGVPQQRILPSVLGALTDADPVARQRTILMAAALLVAAALAGAAVVGALNFQERTPVPLGGQGSIAFVRDGDLYLANPDGSGVVTAAHVDGAMLSKPHWSPDGDLIAVQTEEPAVLLFDRGTGALGRLASGSFGAWSPDGSAVAYFTTNGDIAVVDVESGESRILVARPAGTEGFASEYATLNNEPMAWSPDGRSLVANGSARYPETPFSLISIDVASGRAQTLHTTEDFFQYQPAWSPDSSKIAFAIYADRRASETIWVTNLDGSVTSAISDPGELVQHPLWSPDGEWLAYLAMSGGQGRLKVVRPDGTGARLLASGVEEIVGWNPDGLSVAYTPPADEQQRRELRVVALDGPDRLLQIAGGGGEDYALGVPDLDVPRPSVRPSLAAPTASSPEPAVEAPPAAEPLKPDVSWGGIAFRTQVDDFDCHLGVLRFPDQFSVVSPVRPASPSPEEQPGPGTPRAQLADLCELRFAPDGTAVLRASQRDASFDIVRMDGTVRSGPFPTIGTPPSWSPGGGWIVMPFCDEAGDCSRAAIMRPDGSDRHELPGTPTWSPGDRMVGVAGADGNLQVGPGDGLSLIGIGAFPASISWAPDAMRFVFVKDGDAWVAEADGSGTRNLTAFPLGGAAGAWWSPDGRWILVLKGSTLWAFSPDGTGSQRLGADLGPTDGSWGPAWAPAWSPGGEWVAVEHGQETTLFHAGDWRAVRLDQASQPAWSPDGRHLAVLSDGNGTSRMDVTNPDGSGRITVRTAIDSPPMAWFR